MADSGRDDLRLCLRPRESPARPGFARRSAPRTGSSRASAPMRIASAWRRCSSRFGSPVEWMGVESAEMTKHALNAFLATSVAFINEVAAICERVGADASEVARGPEERAADRPSRVPLAGRRVRRRNAGAGHPLPQPSWPREQGLPANVVNGVATSNAEHRNWSRRALTPSVHRRFEQRRAAPGRAADRALGPDLQAGNEHAAALLGPRAVSMAGWRESIGAGLRSGNQRAARRAESDAHRARAQIRSPRWIAPTPW